MQADSGIVVSLVQTADAVITGPDLEVLAVKYKCQVACGNLFEPKGDNSKSNRASTATETRRELDSGQHFELVVKQVGKQGYASFDPIDTEFLDKIDSWHERNDRRDC